MSRRISEIIGQDTVTMQTYIYPDCVLYTVVEGNPDGGDLSSAIERWRIEVPFGSTKELRAGGYRFAEAARQQEAIAYELFEKLSAEKL